MRPDHLHGTGHKTVRGLLDNNPEVKVERLKLKGVGSAWDY
jgi:hypothetical protein